MSEAPLYTTHDFKHGMPPRIFGSETEYTSSNGIEDIFLPRGMHPDTGVEQQVLDDFIPPEIVVGIGRHTMQSAVLTTGGEMYLDCGDIVEYATPECNTPKELVGHIRAGEEAVLQTLNNADETFSHVFLRRMMLTKRAGFAHVQTGSGVLMIENSLGHHENYYSPMPEYPKHSLARDKLEEEMKASEPMQQIIGFLALRKIIDGVGMVDYDNYSISQKATAFDINNMFTVSTTHGKKIALRVQQDRLEIRTGEGSKSDWAEEFKYSLTSLILRLVEHGKYPRELMLDNPQTALNILCEDPKAKVALKNGDEMRGMDILKNLVDEAMELHIEHPDAPRYERKAALDFYDFYSDLENINLRDNDAKALADRIDWAARFNFLVRRGGTYETLNTRNLNAVRDDLKWDIVGEKDIARKYFHKFGHTALRGIYLPPPNTRAKGRIELAKYLDEHHGVRSIEWDSIELLHGNSYPLLNPYGVSPERIQEIKNMADGRFDDTDFE